MVFAIVHGLETGIGLIPVLGTGLRDLLLILVG